MLEYASRHAEDSAIGLREWEVVTRDGLGLILARYTRNGSEQARPTVLLLHGASASSLTFRIPRARSLVDDLLERGADVWSLDWRGSNRVSPRYRREREKFTLDFAAELDIPLAIAEIRARKREGAALSVLGHCMGAGILAMAIGAGWVGAREVSHAVLSTLGLFYQVPWDGWVKAEDHMLERIRGRQPDVACIDPDPRTKWPDVMQRAYDRWPATLLPLPDNEIFRRLAFMFGRPYRPDLLPEGIHSEEELRRQFGEIPIQLYMHCAQNVRRGFADPFDHTGPDPDGRYLNAESFLGIRLTLITGSRNELWHPDAMNRMHDWLRRGPGKPDCHRRIFPRYAHQDLLWGSAAPQEVYPTIAAGLGLS